MKGKYFFYTLASLILAPAVSAYEWGNLDEFFYRLRPSELLENEWVVFVGIFLLVFGVVFLGISNVFKRKKENKYYPWLEESEYNKGVVAVISMVIALFTAAAIVRRTVIADYLGGVFTLWLTVFFIIAFIILLIPFYKALRTSIGSVALLISLFIVWLTLRLINFPELFSDQYYSYEFVEIYEILRSYVTLVILMIIGVIYMFVKKGG